MAIGCECVGRKFKNPSRISQREELGLSLVELIAVIAVVAILAAVAFGGLSKMLERAKAAQCVSNLRVLGQAALQFAGENNQRMPVAKDWEDRTAAQWWNPLLPYLSQGPLESTGLSAVFRCPNGKGYKLFGKKIAPIKWTATDYTPVVSNPGGYYHYLFSVKLDSTPYLVEAENYSGSLGVSGGTFDALVNEAARERHGTNGINVLYCNGAVRYVTDPTWEKVRPQYFNDKNLAK